MMEHIATLKMLHIILSIILVCFLLAIITTRNVFGYIYWATAIAIIDLYIVWRASL